jgi:uncharacterized membrane protein YdjX (TVP38/TMEM64 family)
MKVAADPPPPIFWRACAALFVLLVFGLVFAVLFDWDHVHLKAAEWTHAWWLVPLLVLAQALPFALALPGSVMFLVIGLLYDPLPATAMIAAGGVAGSTMGYVFSRRLADTWLQRVRTHRLYRLLRDNSSFLMLCALRTLPGFPHSIINYGSGMLRTPLKRFVFSAVVGYTIKGMLYATILHSVVELEEGRALVSLEVLWPLVAVAALLIVGFFLQKYWDHYYEAGPDR